MSGSLFQGVTAGSRYRIVGMPGEPDRQGDGAWLVINSTTNTGQLNCTIEFDDGGRGLATVSPADLATSIEAGWYVSEDRYHAWLAGRYTEWLAEQPAPPVHVPDDPEGVVLRNVAE